MTQGRSGMSGAGRGRRVALVKRVVPGSPGWSSPLALWCVYSGAEGQGVVGRSGRSGARWAGGFRGREVRAESGLGGSPSGVSNHFESKTQSARPRTPGLIGARNLDPEQGESGYGQQHDRLAVGKPIC